MELLTGTRALARVDARLQGLDGVLWLLDRLLDGSVHYSLPQTAAAGSRRLFDRVLCRMKTAHEDPLLVQNWLAKAMKRAIASADLTGVSPTSSLKPYAEVAWRHSTPSEKLLRAIADGNVEAVQWSRPRSGWIENFIVYNAVGESGHLHVLQWFCEYEYPDWPPRRYGLNNIDSAASSGAAHGHLAILEWLYEAISYRATPEMLGAAAERGQLDVFRWVYQRDGNAAMTSDVMDIAAGNGHLPLVKWLHEHSSAGCTKAAMDDAASCDLDVIQWLHSHRSEGCTTNAMVQAAHYGHLDVVVWLHKHRAEGCAEDSVDPISVHVLKWFAANRSYKGTSEAMEAAAQRGDLESLKVRLGIGSQVPSVSVAASAAIRGHLGVLEWIYERYPAQFDVEKVREQGEKHPYVNAWLESVCDYSSEVC